MNLTREEIERIPAGQAVNILIAIEVFGAYWRKSVGASEQLIVNFPDYKGPVASRKTRLGKPLANDTPHVYGFGHEWLPDYSQDIKAAWSILTAMRLKGWYSQHTDLTLGTGGEWWAWHFLHQAPPGNQQVSTTANSAPLAICRAALLASLAPAVAGGAGEEGEASPA